MLQRTAKSATAEQGVDMIPPCQQAIASETTNILVSLFSDHWM